MKQQVPFAMLMAVLTQFQSGIVLGCFVFIFVMMIFGIIKTLNRISALEKVVFAGNKIAIEAQDTIDSSKTMLHEDEVM